MTPTELREALIAEAKRRALANQPMISAAQADSALAQLADLIESNWRPEPEVDVVGVAWRKWVSTPDLTAGMEEAFRAGHAHALKAARQALETTNDQT